MSKNINFVRGADLLHGFTQGSVNGIIVISFHFAARKTDLSTVVVRFVRFSLDESDKDVIQAMVE